MDERKERIKEILEEASAVVSSTERSKFVAAACKGDPDLTDEVTSLLAGADSSFLSDFLNKGLPRIVQDVAASVGSLVDNDTGQLKREEDEERSLWESAFIGDPFDGKGRYEITKLRRFGLMACLFYGTDRKMGSQVIVKIPRRSAYVNSKQVYEDLKNLNANIRNNFRREFDALRKLQNCSYVVRVQDFGELPDGRPFMILEFIDGTNALELLNANRDSNGRRTGLAFHDVGNIIKQAGKGLQAAHELSILHRDMKAENVMITHDGHVKLIDFNAADVKLPLSPMSTVFQHQTWGTLGYVSPEQLQNMMETDVLRTPIPLIPASDVYSLAVTAYQLLTGQMPFSRNVKELIQQQATCSFRAPSELRTGITSHIDQLITSALNPNPLNRPQTVQSFTSAFSSAVASLEHGSTEIFSDRHPQRLVINSDEVQQKPPLQDQKRVRSIGKRVVVVTVLLLLIVATVVGWFAYTGRRGQPSEVLGNKGDQPGRSGTGNVRSFSYWLDLTRTHNGRPADRSIKASGQEVFTNGDSFIVNFSSSANGHLYLLNEGRNFKDITTFYYQGKYDIRSGIRASSTRLAFDNKDGEEQFWFVFSSSPIEIFEQFNAPREIPETETNRVRGFLNETIPQDLTSTEDVANAETKVKGSGDTLVYKAMLRHRKPE